MHAVRNHAWQLLAEQEGLPLPEAMLSHPELHTMSPEVAIVRMLRWADNRNDATRLALEHAALAADALSMLSMPKPGVTAPVLFKIVMGYGAVPPSRASGVRHV